MKFADARIVSAYTQTVLLPAVKRVTYLYKSGQQNTPKFAVAMVDLNLARAVAPQPLLASSQKAVEVNSLV